MNWTEEGRGWFLFCFFLCVCVMVYNISVYWILNAYYRYFVFSLWGILALNITFFFYYVHNYLIKNFMRVFDFTVLVVVLCVCVCVCVCCFFLIYLLLNGGTWLVHLAGTWIRLVNRCKGNRCMKFIWRIFEACFCLLIDRDACLTVRLRIMGCPMI
jgi:hypothetical protein